MLNATAHRPATLLGSDYPRTFVGPVFRPSLAQVQAANEKAGGTFLAPAVMRENGETLRSFRIVSLDGHVWVERKADGERFRFYPTTGRIAERG